MGYPCAYTNSLMGSWWVHLDETWAEDGYAPLVSGSVTIAVNGEVASVTVNAVDDLGHKITGVYNDIPYTLEGASDWSLNKLSTGAKMAKHAKMQLAPRKVKISSLIKK